MKKRAVFAAIMMLELIIIVYQQTTAPNNKRRKLDQSKSRIFTVSLKATRVFRKVQKGHTFSLELPEILI